MHQPFITERTYNAPLPIVWKAISENEALKKWYFDLPEFKAEVGFEFTFVGGDDHQKYLHLCKITEVIPNQKLSYSWKYAGYEGISMVTFELFAQGNQTRLKLTHAGLETFPEKNPSFAKENFAAGWTSILGNSLNNYLENS